MISIRRSLLLAGLVCSGLACSGPPTETMRLRHDGQEYRMTYQPGPAGPTFLDGPDTAAITLLLSHPQAGLAPDTLEDDLTWVYRDEQEREQVLAILKTRKRTMAAPPASDPTLEASCRGADVTLFRGVDYGGEPFSRGGQFFDPDLRTTGWDDSIASLKFQGSQVILYEHLDGKGHNLSLLPQIEVNDSTGCWGQLGEYPSLRKFIMLLRPIPGHGNLPVSWDHQATSMLLLDAR